MRTSTARSGLPATSCPLRIASQPIRPRCTALPRLFRNNPESCRGSCATCCAAAASPSAATQGTPAEDSGFQRFKELCSQHSIVPLFQRVYSDQLTPVLAYRCLVKEDDREMPSFLLESVVNGDQSGRYSFIGSHPSLEVVACGNQVTVLDHHTGQRTVTHEADPMDVPVRLSRQWKPARIEGLPDVFTGGWVGFAGYDTVRYVYPGKLPLSDAPEDDRQLPDMHLALYNNVVVFDQATKLAYVVSWVHPAEYPSIEAAYVAGKQHLNSVSAQLTPQTAPSLANARVDIDLTKRPQPPAHSNMTKQEFLDAVDATKEYIQAGDVFQLVLSQRFERRTYADPFEIYRSLRIVNPSPYMVYLQVRGAILVASSPEILCNVDGSSIVTNRPLAGTRQRGATPERDLELEQDLLADEKECAEHVMLVDLGRNDVGKVSKGGSVKVDRLMDIERYSHVMHISSTVTGKLLPDLDCWDALRAALPAGTVSGAPKVRAMQIIDELESTRRGPYGGGIGHVSFTGEMDMALALRTMVIPLGRNDTMYQYGNAHPRREWVVHLQAGAGLVADSVPEKEYEETVNKAAALSRAIDLAEKAFVDTPVGL